MISLAGLREALDAGGIVEVECIDAPFRQTNSYRGAWKFYVIAEVDGAEHRLLFVHGRDIKARVIRTATGLISFGIELGVSPIAIPLHAGERAIWRRYAGEPEETRG
ncbi:hypothetical protein ATO3_17400 [Marinibacterium profundimaris]|uniref:Uncharacterized protein n=1 Tax=Marinibacterium profundimaris TaxID=1679460 RepID=A0A225NHH9_9RHOB|nr:hypothetical protein ATO3_17400 [Marinibacterium profundimaris]